MFAILLFAVLCQYSFGIQKYDAKVNAVVDVSCKLTYQKACCNEFYDGFKSNFYIRIFCIRIFDIQL